jgi:hypothetical protein
MGNPSARKRKIDELKSRPKRAPKKFKKQAEYHSDSDEEEQEEFKPVSLEESEDEEEEQDDEPDVAAESSDDNAAPEGADPESEVTDGSNSDSESEEEDSDNESNPNLTKMKKRKRNDPEAFATSMSKILSSKLSTSKRSDPVLSRSKDALEAANEIQDLALEKKAKSKLREEKRLAMDKGRIRDVLGASTAFDQARGVPISAPTVAETMETERRLRKTAQRGVVKLFNAVRGAQIKGEEAARDARRKGIVGSQRREEKVTEMSKQGFLELIAGGAGGLKTGGIEEA